MVDEVIYSFIFLVCMILFVHSFIYLFPYYRGPYARGANSPLNRVCLPNGDYNEKFGMCIHGIGLFGQPKRI